MVVEDIVVDGGDRRRHTAKFKFPLSTGTEIPSLGKEKVCVVSVIGKSPFDANNCKAVEVDGLLQRNIFQFGSGRIPDSDDIDSVQTSGIEGYHDADNHVLYLHLVGATDTRRLVDLCRSLEVELRSMGFLHVWAEMKCSQANQLLLLFLISHIILVVHPVPTFDVSYVHLFRTLDTIRQKAHPYMGEVLRDCAVSGDWAQAGRPCCPRVLFLFRTANLDTSLLDDSGKTVGSGRTINKKFSPLKKLEHALEDQIYRILRKSRIITNISMNSLFAIPANQEFVYVQSPEGCFTNSAHFYLQRLQEHCLGFSTGLDEAIRPPPQSRDCGTSLNRLLSDGKDTEHRFKTFLGKHIELAFTKGFDDNVGRHSGTAVFELPTGTTWLKVTTKLYKLLFDNASETISKEVVGALRSQIDIDGKFSEARCNKVLPVATAAYQEGLPSHYSYEVHQSRLTQAYRLFAMHARGPVFERYATQLQEECEKFWKNGHQLCEVHSLTGNPCLKPIHRLPTDAEETDAVTAEGGKAPIPITPHCSQVKLMSVCNCGRKQASREDPFDSKAANYDFYEQLAKLCCIELDRHEFPVFQPSISNYKAAEIIMAQWRTACIAASQRHAPRIERELSVVAPGMSLALSLGQSLGTSEDASGRLSTRLEPSPQDIDRSEEPLSIPELPEACASSDKEDKILIRQMSTTEYLPGMLHSESPAGLLPTFPSWSLVCLGPSSLYSHNIGIHDQPNFISGTNFLLPWDVTVKSEKDRWPTIAETSSRKGQHIPLKGKKGGRDFSEFTVKIFLGVEYECPRGHRFMCSAPDKILKASGTGLVKENASKITSSDMPLHFPCPCRRTCVCAQMVELWTHSDGGRTVRPPIRLQFHLTPREMPEADVMSTKPVIAQLMRIHIVTPKAPVHVTLDPKVQPAPSLTPCPVFYPGNQEPIKLTQSTYWVLRLPFIYEGDQGPFLQPKEKKASNYGRLLKGLYSVTQVGPNV